MSRGTLWPRSAVLRMVEKHLLCERGALTQAQMKRQRSAIGTARLGTRLCRLRVLLVVTGLALGNCLFAPLQKSTGLAAIRTRTPPDSGTPGMLLISPP